MSSSVNSPTDAFAAFNRRLLEQVMQPFAQAGTTPKSSEIIQSLAAGLAKDTQHWLDIQNRYYQKQLELWSAFSSGAADAEPPKIVEPRPGDRRFRSPEWKQPYFSFLAQSYLLTARWLTELIESAQLEP